MHDFTKLYRMDLPHRAISVYIYLADRANKDGICWPSIPTISKDLKLSECERLSGEGIEGYYIEKGDRKSVVWLNNSEGKIYTLASGALGKDSLLQIANTLQGLEDTNS